MNRSAYDRFHGSNDEHFDESEDEDPILLSDGDPVVLSCDLYCDAQLRKGDHGIIRRTSKGEWGVEFDGVIYYTAVKDKRDSVTVISQVDPIGGS